MAVYKRGERWHYRFQVDGQPFSGTAGANGGKADAVALDAFQNAGFPEATVDDSKAGALRAALEEAVAVLHSAGCDVTADACRRALTKQT